MSAVLAREFEILEAANGAEALLLIRRDRPEVVLLDVMMPGALDGLQVLDAIRLDDSLRSCRVAIVSACAQDADLESARRRGADAYFIKPFSPVQVASWVREHMQ